MIKAGLPAATLVSRWANLEAEIADAKLYNELMPKTDSPDLVGVFSNLQAASLYFNPNGQNRGRTNMMMANSSRVSGRPTRR